MNSVLKIVFVIGFSFVLKISFAQSIIYQLGKNNQIKGGKEFIIEIATFFDKVEDSLKIDFNHSDTLYIIRGVDIQSRTGYGYVWNNKVKISYVDNKKWRRDKIVESKPVIEIKAQQMPWYQFDDLIPLIDHWDKKKIKDYVDNCDKVLSGIYSWEIIRAVKQNSYYDIVEISVRDFGVGVKND
ncbi:hypothetical protein PK28_06095 [Hymenobacter sp. DG25B]|uniref:hypothetical protein n=1 Tax=Hymenobacter sp. DG25B TaxID=1385664 RepID=UPI000540AD41|nr:hypothetical protein [Hymenobacter sp. DG25B]AIZ63374.1 hypothetical protein PK28_06095 [Hymenobacter sp. DG25B]